MKKILCLLFVSVLLATSFISNIGIADQNESIIDKLDIYFADSDYMKKYSSIEEIQNKLTGFAARAALDMALLGYAVNLNVSPVYAVNPQKDNCIEIIYNLQDGKQCVRIAYNTELQSFVYQFAEMDRYDLAEACVNELGMPPYVAIDNLYEIASNVDLLLLLEGK